jgi:hypothetical protein
LQVVRTFLFLLLVSGGLPTNSAPPQIQGGAPREAA